MTLSATIVRLLDNTKTLVLFEKKLKENITGGMASSIFAGWYGFVYSGCFK